MEESTDLAALPSQVSRMNFDKLFLVSKRCVKFIIDDVPIGYLSCQR